MTRHWNEPPAQAPAPDFEKSLAELEAIKIESTSRL